MAENKATSSRWLGIHSLVYCLPFFWLGFWFVLVTGMLHFIVDGVTSQLTKICWKKRKIRLFFITIGFDQAIHFCFLIFTYLYFVGGIR
jgi:hypothetical protein